MNFFCLYKQNKVMKTSIIKSVILSLICSGICVCCLPSPSVKTGFNALTTEEQAIINDAFEEEVSKFNDNINYTELLNKVNNVTKLDWFDVVNNFFTKYTLTAKVIDCKTKKAYSVIRVGGYNHADVQPIDAENTAIMKSIYDNEWSWVRRPVWVEINGSYVAGSINGMPHGYTLIEGNNMDGHTCIHFLNSKTHGTKRVDEAHQEAVAYAFEHKNELLEYLLKENSNY